MIANGWLDGELGATAEGGGTGPRIGGSRADTGDGFAEEEEAGGCAGATVGVLLEVTAMGDTGPAVRGGGAALASVQAETANQHTPRDHVHSMLSALLQDYSSPAGHALPGPPLADLNSARSADPGVYSAPQGAIIADSREEHILSYSMFGCWAIVSLSLLSSACGDTSDSPGAAGANPGVILGRAGGSGSGGSSGSGSSGAGSSAGVGNSAGAGSSGSACPQVPPCGGDLLGDWTILQACIDVPIDLFSDLCPGSTIKLSPFTATGTVSFKADNTTVSSGVISFVETTQYPASCVSEAQCAASGAAFAKDPRYSNGRCLFDSSTGCTCTVTSTQTPMSNGTYQVQGTDVILSGSNGQTAVDSFCVSGNTLSLYETNANGASSTLILTR